jgi:hypothetical protein
MQWNFTWDVVSDSHHINLCFAAVNSCYDIVNVLREKGYIAQVKDSKNCVIFDDGAYKRDQKPMNARIQQFCGVSQRIDTMRRPVLFFMAHLNSFYLDNHFQSRDPLYYNKEMAEPDILHFHTSSNDDYRILNVSECLFFFCIESKKLPNPTHTLCQYASSTSTQ